LFNASTSEIAKLNNLSEPYIVRKGQILRLPAPQPKLAEEFSADAAPKTFTSDEAAGTITSVPLPVASVEAEVLVPPPGMMQTSSLTPPAQYPATTSPSAIKPAAGFPPQPTAKNTLTVPAAKVQTVSVPPSIAPKIPARSGTGRFMRPVDGKIISGYGPKDDGLHNDGINIKAAKGTAVRAAENGVVAYTGSGMSGYGNLVLIRHQDRWMTAYAHMDKILVKKGDTVKAGQSIGTVGSTGQVDSSQLHFEVRKGTQAVDPAKYL
jgi:murein DD-endopeptidase MepM/ murein hydrolase activator NlpD